MDGLHVFHLSGFHVIVDYFWGYCQGSELLLTVHVAIAGEDVVDCDMQAVQRHRQRANANTLGPDSQGQCSVIYYRGPWPGELVDLRL